jgi:hypothetical protein
MAPKSTKSVQAVQKCLYMRTRTDSCLQRHKASLPLCSCLVSLSSLALCLLPCVTEVAEDTVASVALGIAVTGKSCALLLTTSFPSDRPEK